MGQHQSLVAGEESVGIMPAVPNNALLQPCKDLETPDRANGSSGDKGTELSFRAAIDKFIESCLSSPQNSSESMEDGSVPTKIKDEKKNLDTLDNSGASNSLEEKSVEDGKMPEVKFEEPFDKAKSFSSFLQMRIRDMIVNCENDDDLTRNDHTKISSASPINQPSTTVSSPHVSNNMLPEVATSNSIVPICSTRSDTSGLNSNKYHSMMTSVPLQTLIDKVLDNSLGDQSVCKPMQHKTNNTITQKVDVPGFESKPKNNASYEIAAESAKVVSEKVSRCVERNLNSTENNGGAKIKTGICLMTHIENVLERNFAQMSQNDEENETPPLVIRPNLLPQIEVDSTAETMKFHSIQSVVCKAENPSEPVGPIKNYDHPVKNHKSFSVNDNPPQSVSASHEGSVSVQDIVNGVISQTEVISQLLSPSTMTTTTTDSVTENMAPSHFYERNIIKTPNVSKSDSHSNYTRREILSTDPYKAQKAFHQTASSMKQSMASLRPGDHSERHLRINPGIYQDKNMLHKSNPYMTPEYQEPQYIDPRLVGEAQRQKMIQENMMLFSRYPYSNVHMSAGIDPNHVPSHPLMRYPQTQLAHHRIPPPLLRVDTIPDPVAAIPHPYNKACPCVSCSTPRVHVEEFKQSPKHHNVGLLVPPNSMSSPSTSPHYQSRLSPHSSKEIRIGSSPSPNRYHHQPHHPSAFTRIKDPLMDKERAQKIYAEEFLHLKRSRIENGIDTLYNDRRRQPESYGPKAVEGVYPKNNYQAAIHSRHVEAPQDTLAKLPVMDLAYGSKADLQISSSDQPLDLTKKKQKVINMPDQDNYKWKVSRANDDHFDRSRPAKSRIVDHQTVVDQRVFSIPSGYSAPENYPFSSEKKSLKYNERYLPSQMSGPYISHKQELNRTQETSAAMTPGMMPEQLGSPGGKRAQLHPLPSPNLSTSYTQPPSSSSPKVLNHVSSPRSRSPDVERLGLSIVESNNISRPSSQCSSSSLDQDKDRKGSISRHEPIQNIIGAHPPNDILYLICRLCRQTYGSPYGFRKHFRNQHGFEPRAEHTIVQTISATKSAMQHIPDMPHSPTNMLPSPNIMQAVYQPVVEGSFYDSVDIPKIRERALSDSKLVKPATYSETKSTRPTGSRSAESERANIKEETDDTKFLQCEQCKQTFQLNDFGSYKRHCRQHNQTRTIGPFHCQICPSSFQEPQLLEEHILKHDAESVVCKYCKIPYANRMYLTDHMTKVHGHKLSSNISSCKYCELSFLDHNDLHDHIQKVHGRLLLSDKVADVKQVTPLGSEPLREKSFATCSVDVQPADQMTILSCPDSSSDNLLEEKDSLVVSNSTNKKTNDPGRCSSSDTRSNENSQDTVFSNSDAGEESVYKHKKFFGHRKRKESLDTNNMVPIKCPKIHKAVSEAKFDDATVDSSVSCSSSSNGSESDKKCDSSSIHINAVNESDMSTLDSDNQLQNKQEARHQMPFVWDRITRSQAGKNIKPPNYMS